MATESPEAYSKVPGHRQFPADVDTYIFYRINYIYSTTHTTKHHSEIKKIKLSFKQLNSMVLNRLLIQT